MSRVGMTFIGADVISARMLLRHANIVTTHECHLDTLYDAPV
jgi:hypothetical protein